MKRLSFILEMKYIFMQETFVQGIRVLHPRQV